MRRAFTTREKVLLVVLAVLIIGICYYKFLLQPINNDIEMYQLNTVTEQDMILQKMADRFKMREMEKELDEIHATGDVKPLPAYDNAEKMLVDLNTILAKSDSYSLNFGSVEALEESPYIIYRPLSLSFSCSTYEQARGIIDELHDSDDINQISDLSISFNDNAKVDVLMTISFFELSD